MSFKSWIDYIESADKTSFITANRRRIHYKFPDNVEMIEEYSMDTGICIKRAWKKRRDVLCMDDDNMSNINFNWDIELGEHIHSLQSNDFTLKESNSEVITFYNGFPYLITMFYLL